jgi:hypothetical protein
MRIIIVLFLLFGITETRRGKKEEIPYTWKRTEDNRIICVPKE